MLKVIIAVLVFVGLSVAQDCSDGCVDPDGNCVAVGGDWMELAMNDQFCAYKRCNSAGEASVYSYECYYEPEDRCLQPGDSVSTGVCTEVVCTVQDSGAINRASVINGCPDSSDTCQEVGASGFSAIVEGVEYSNCDCSTSVNDEGNTVYNTNCS